MTSTEGALRPAEWALRPDARLQLLPQRAAFDPDRSLLLIADAHIGKAVSFRRLGVPVPHGTTGEALARLDELLAATGARHLVFLGDFLHSPRSHAASAPAPWCIPAPCWAATDEPIAPALKRSASPTAFPSPLHSSSNAHSPCDPPYDPPLLRWPPHS